MCFQPRLNLIGPSAHYLSWVHTSSCYAMLVGYYSGGKIKSIKITTDKIVLCIPMLTKNGRKVTPLLPRLTPFETPWVEHPISPWCLWKVISQYAQYMCLYACINITLAINPTILQLLTLISSEIFSWISVCISYWLDAYVQWSDSSIVVSQTFWLHFNSAWLISWPRGQ